MCFSWVSCFFFLSSQRPFFFGHSLFLVKPKIFAVQGQRGPKRGFPTLRCDAPKGGWRCKRCDALGGGWRCDAARGRRRCDAATLRRCNAAVGPVTLRRCWRCDAATLRRWSDAATLSALRRCDAGATLRRCWRCDAATREQRCDAVGAATLRRCDAGATLPRWSDAATLLALRRFLLQECTQRCFAARHARCILRDWCELEAS